MRMGKQRKVASAVSSSPKTPTFANIPDVADMGSLVRGGNKNAKLVPDNCIRMGLYEYANQGSLYSDVFSAEKLWLAQLRTSLEPNPLYKMKGLVEKHVQAMLGEEDPPPATLDDVGFRFRAVYQFVWKKTDDSDGIGWAKKRFGWYIDEAYVKEFLMYFDEFMAWRKGRGDEDFEPIDAEIKIVIHMLNSSTVKLTMNKGGG